MVEDKRKPSSMVGDGHIPIDKISFRLQFYEQIIQSASL